MSWMRLIPCVEFRLSLKLKGLLLSTYKNPSSPSHPSALPTTTAMFYFLAPLLFLLVVLLLQRRRPSPSSGSKRLPLPPGSLGWPYIGETFQLYSNDPNLFFTAKQAKYGPIFKSHVLGCPCVMITSPEAVRFVLVTWAHLFKPTFPASKERMLGKQAIFFHQGDYHLRLRKLVLRAFSPDSIRHLVPAVDDMAAAALVSLSAHHTVTSTFQELKTFAFNVALLSILGPDEVHHREDLKRCYYVLERGYNSMPINLPGTLFRKSMAARAELAGILAEIIAARRSNLIASGTAAGNDLLAYFMADEEGLSDEQIADNVIGVIFAARDTTASVLTWVVKFLADNPSVLEAVLEEQESITMEEGKEAGKKKKKLSWGDTKRMPFTTRVIQETMRVASILSFTFREAVEDVEFEGYLIPKGWKVLPLFRNIHHSPFNFPSPHKFDPSRFEMAPKPNTFLPFGNGVHSCPGNELAKLEILVFVHHLTTKYRWTILGPQNEIEYGPFALPQNGLPIKLHPKSQTS